MSRLAGAYHGAWIERPQNAAIQVHRRSLPTPAHRHELAPRLAVVLQGAKRVRLDGQSRAWVAGDCTVIAARMPVVSSVTHAAPYAPYLGLMMALDPAVVAGALDRAAALAAGPGSGPATRPLSPPVARALADVFAGAPHAEQRLVERLVADGHGDALRGFVHRARLDPIAARAIAWLEDHAAEPLSIAALASAIGASTSTVHHRFKRATGTTPLQFHKRLRLEHARRLIATYELGAAAAARAVGYASAAQFSRDYRRAFALPPFQDRQRMIAAAARERSI